MGVPEAGEVAARVAERLSTTRGTPVSVGSARQLPAGASRATYAATLVDAAGTPEPIVIRAVPTADDDGGLGAEAEVLRAAADAGVPVPKILDAGLGDDSVLGFPYLAMNFIGGESIPRRILRDDTYAAARDRFVEQCGRILARVHRIDATQTPGLEELVDPVDALHTLFPREFDAMPAGLVLATQWLVANPPPASPGSCVVHGDFRLGNLLVDADGVAAVLDWELVHIGDPVEDLGWLCAKAWRFGGSAPVAGMGGRAALLDAYAEVAGWRPTEEALRWWELYATVKWGLICAVQANRHLDGVERSVELAAIGRRSAEQEFDALLDLGIVSPEVVADPLGVDTPGPDEEPHGSPSSLELLDALAGFLRSDSVTAEMSPQVRFHTRVAGNVVDVVRRQVLLGATHAAESAQRLAALGVADQRALCDALRSGELDGTDEKVRAAIAADVRARLLVANPKYFAVPHP
ncbi:putative aminoglycoside phosphotransferase [Gordonia namibiensis NBRC 108229]|uniref:Putative aminoglycoside phosphotransferase n=1 Tax=Gordonia namibiensis NBRC 108229 TaxID=1208314 RepID=K6W1V7_9ACTN|nr:phosphotransferase family protein [Gordonia namibiensis]GAC02519.1 putative aminoglycoside phosphotransferase [Gordonia namibiensis NBRC 108229]